jgi:hypothetical protein
LAALGTAIGVLVAVIGLPYGRADYTAFAELYHGTADTAGTVHVAVDCDTVAAGDQALCNVNLPAPATLAADVTVGNSTAGAIIIGTFNFTLVHAFDSHLNAANNPDQLNGNPDFMADATDLADWSCGPPNPDDDLNEAPPGADPPDAGEDSFISCFNAVGSGPSLAAGPAHITLARVTYATVGGGPQLVPLTLQDTAVADDTFTEVMSCNPVVTVAGPCFNSAFNFQNPPPTDTPEPGPTDTPTNTPTVTNTATNTPLPTDTPTPLSDSGVVKECEDGIQLDNGQACNLWICEPDDNALNDPDCDGPGEGSLHVHEVALNVPAIPQADPNYNGLGAYEFSVEYDNFVIQSVNPCDFVFGPANGTEGAGAGAARGPVDELDSSSPANPDCTPDPGAVNNGSCTMSIVLENIIHFGCATLGQNPPGPTGSFVLASLELIPHPDLNNDLFPGNNNGVLTVIKDNGCELVDTLGHPIPGSVNGGLTKLCRDLAVTVRILEGDLDLDCDVDVTDAQAIASHYGAFFGGLLYSKWLDLEPQFHDLDIDIKDVQKVFGRQGSTCQDPIPAQDPLPPPVPFQD